MKEFKTISIEELKQNTNPDYISDGFIIYNNIAREREFLHKQVVHKQIYITGTFSFSLCRQGTTEIAIGTQKYRIKKNDLVIVLPKQLVDFYQTSPDYDAGLICISGDYFKEKFQGTIPLFLAMKYQPVITLNEEEVNLLEWYQLLLSKRTTNPNSQFFYTAVHNLIHALFYELYGFIVNHTQSNEFKLSHQMNIFNQFIILVEEHHVKERNVLFYADKLCLTPKYLSAIVYKASGKFAGEWIDHYVITLAKSLLASSNQTVQEIGYELNFSTPSSFTKYFKRIMNITPREYRNIQANNYKGFPDMEIL